VKLPVGPSYNDRPAALPAGPHADLVVERTGPAGGTRSATVKLGSSLVKSTVEAPLTRLQIGSATLAGGVSSMGRVSCYDNYPQALLQPARWETLGPGADGAVHYRLTDAWFDARECTGVVIGTVDVVVTPLAGGLMYAFVDECEECGHARLVVLSPSGQARASSVGGLAQAGGGSFTVAVLPLVRGGSAVFAAQVAGAGMLEWFRGFGRKESALDGAAVLGVELAQTVGDSDATAIAYATIVQSRGPDGAFVSLSAFGRPQKLRRPPPPHPPRIPPKPRGTSTRLMTKQHGF
jgi:hypothetical protein